MRQRRPAEKSRAVFGYREPKSETLVKRVRARCEKLVGKKFTRGEDTFIIDSVSEPKPMSNPKGLTSRRSVFFKVEARAYGPNFAGLRFLSMGLSARFELDEDLSYRIKADPYFPEEALRCMKP
jgi:hypothetical protein